jgi:hypothetical protein
MPKDLVGYVNDAIRRVSADMAASQNGSHVAGIFNKAASAFEKRVAALAGTVTGRSDLEKMTLGALIGILEKAPNADEEPLRTVIAGAKEVNNPWKKVKHGEDPPIAELLLGLRKISDVLGAL